VAAGRRYRHDRDARCGSADRDRNGESSGEIARGTLRDVFGVAAICNGLRRTIGTDEVGGRCDPLLLAYIVRTMAA
jgi:hypothetical protein